MQLKKKNTPERKGDVDNSNSWLPYFINFFVSSFIDHVSILGLQSWYVIFVLAPDAYPF